MRSPAGRGRVPTTPTPEPVGRPGDIAFNDDDDFLELDLPNARLTPLPGELALPTAHTAGDLGALDLPTPVQKPNDGLAPRRGPGPKAPPPPPAHGQAFTTPGVDLPPPSRFDVPAQPRRGSVPPLRELDLPAPETLDLPQPLGLDLPTPSDVDLPMPIGLDLEPVNNMLQPASLDLEPQGNWVAPAELGVQPAELNVQPAELGVEPANLGLEPANLGVAPFARAKPVDDAAPGEAARGRGPAVRGIERQGVSRGLLYGGAAVLLLGAFAAVLLYTGVFDEEIPDTSARGLPKKKDPKAEQTDAKGMPVAPAAERTEAILAQLAADTPKSYADAAEAAKAAGDRLGYAEALLLLSHRYGPDTALVAQASELVQPYATNNEPFVTRVRGLVAIATGDVAGAAKVLAGESPREQLYGGFILLAQGKHDDAIVAAKAVLTADASSLAALHMQHAAGLAKDASKELPLLEASAKKHPDHPGLQELRLRAGIQLGHLATATDALAKILAVEGAPPPFLARRAALEGMVAAAQGDLITAAAKYDAALALSPGNLDARIGKVRTLLAAGNVQALLPEIKALAGEQPNDPTVALLRVEVAIAAGNFDEAITMLDGLDKTLPDRVEVPFFRGQVHAMRMQVDEAKAAFAKALDKDPQFWAASLAEAEMLGAARMPTEAVAVLDGALRRANEAGASGPVQSKLLFAKAKLLARQGQTAAALAALDTAMDVDPTSNDAQVLRGQLRLDAGEPAAGKDDLVAVYERTGGYPGLAGPLGRIFVGEGKIEDAQKLVGDGADDERAPVDVKLVAARIEIAKRNPDAAKTHLSHVLAQDGANWEAQMLMAEAFLVAGDYAEALARVNQAQPGTAKAELHLLKGKILEFNGRHTEARPEYLAALKIDPTRHEARFLYGRLLAHEGAAGPAKAELTQVIEATGDAIPEAWLNLGRAQRELGENDEAIKSLAKATSLEPTLQEGFYLEGRIHADRNKHSKAIELFEKATADDVKGEWVPAAWASLGRAQAKAGQNAAAKASFKKFLEIAPENDPSRGEAERQLRTL